jgi:endonuclease/exonuclease/phosphatase (EEP) superfamily protein YafD
MEDDLSVLALNTQCYQQGVDRIGAFIHASNSDVVLLSENHTSKEKTLKDVLPNHWQLHGTENETAIATRLPVVSFQLVELPTKEISLTKHNQVEALKKGVSRKFAHAVILYQNQPIHVISLRFIAGRGPSYEPWDQLTWGIHLLKEQQAELKFVMRYLSNLRGPVIFGGDLNAPPGSFPIKRLSENFQDSRFTSHTFGGFTFRNTVLPTLRLDYIYHSKEFVTKSLDIMKVKVSDHYPVIGEFYLKDPDISLRLGHHKKNSI